MTAKYETVMVCSVKNGEEAAKAIVERIQALIEKNASLENVEEWGTRRLAYPINYEHEGYYVIFTYDCEPEFPAELDRIFRITDGVMRSMIVCKDQ